MRRANASSTRRTSPAGTSCAGSTRPGSAAAGRPAAESTDAAQADTEHYDAEESANAAVQKALRFWGSPSLSSTTTKELHSFSARVESIATDDWQQEAYRALRQNALRMLIASSPEFQTA